MWLEKRKRATESLLHVCPSNSREDRRRGGPARQVGGDRTACHTGAREPGPLRRALIATAHSHSAPRPSLASFSVHMPGSLNASGQLLRERTAIHSSTTQLEDVIAQAQAVRGRLRARLVPQVVGVGFVPA